MLGIGAEIEKIEKHSDIILLFLLDELVDEMADIAVESQGKDDPNVSEYETRAEAIEALRESVAELGGRMKDLRSGESSSFSQKCLYQFVSLFTPSISVKQGSGDSLINVVTPAMQELGPAWRYWLKA